MSNKTYIAKQETLNNILSKLSNVAHIKDVDNISNILTSGISILDEGYSSISFKTNWQSSSTVTINGCGVLYLQSLADVIITSIDGVSTNYDSNKYQYGIVQMGACSSLVVPFNKSIAFYSRDTDYATKVSYVAYLK